MPVVVKLSVQAFPRNLLIARGAQSAALLLCQRGNIKYSQQLTKLLGTAKYLIIPSRREPLGLDFGLKRVAGRNAVFKCTGGHGCHGEITFGHAESAFGDR